MIKRLMSLMLALVLTLSAIPFVAKAEESNLGMRKLAPGESYTQMTTSQDMVDMIKDMEGFHSTPYWDYSQWTIGFGSACGYDKNKKPDLTITMAEGEVMLREDLKTDYEKTVNKYCESIGRQPSQQQFDALVDLTYNVGGSWTRGCMLTTWLENPTTEMDFVNAIGRWGRAGGKVNYAICCRRIREAIVFMKGEYSLTNGNLDLDTDMELIPNNKLPYYKLVVYDANGGDFNGKSDDMSYFAVGTKYGKFTTPVREGYTCVGWKVTKENSKGLSSTYELDRSDEVVKHLHISAIWESGVFETEPVEPEPEETEPEVTEPEVTEPEVTEPEETEPEVTEPEKPDSGENNPGEDVPGEQKVVYGTVKVNSSLKIRSGPGADYSVVGYLKNNDRVKITEQVTVETSVWGKIESGWICLDYVVLDEDAAEDAPDDNEPEETKPGIVVPDLDADVNLPFRDVSAKAWYRGSVEFVYANGYMNGVNKTTFSPEGYMNRAMFVTVLYRIAGAPAVSENQLGSFTDVPAKEYYAKAVAWAKANGIVNGVSPTSFSPSARITRQDAITIFHRFYTEYLKLEYDSDQSLSGFADGAKVASYAKKPMSWAVAGGIINGSDSAAGKVLNPQKTLTRAEAAAILERLVYLVLGSD